VHDFSPDFKFFGRNKKNRGVFAPRLVIKKAVFLDGSARNLEMKPVSGTQKCLESQKALVPETWYCSA